MIFVKQNNKRVLPGSSKPVLSKKIFWMLLIKQKTSSTRCISYLLHINSLYSVYIACTFILVTDDQYWLVSYVSEWWCVSECRNTFIIILYVYKIIGKLLTINNSSLNIAWTVIICVLKKQHLFFVIYKKTYISNSDGWVGNITVKVLIIRGRYLCKLC